MKKLLAILFCLPLLAQQYSVQYNSTSKKIVAPTNILGMTFGNQVYTNLLGGGLALTNGTLSAADALYKLWVDPTLYQATNSALTALASDPSLYQATNGNLTLLSATPTIWQQTNAALTALAANPNLYQSTNGTLTRFAGIGAGTTGDILYHDGTGWTNLAKGLDGRVLELSGGFPSWQTDDVGIGGSGDDVWVNHGDVLNPNFTNAAAAEITWTVANVTNVYPELAASITRDSELSLFLTEASAYSLYQGTNGNLTLLSAYGPTTWQATNAALTALANNPQLYQATNAALTALAGNPQLYQATNAALTALAADPNLYQATNANLTTLATGEAGGLTVAAAAGATNATQLVTLAQLQSANPGGQSSYFNLAQDASGFGGFTSASTNLNSLTPVSTITTNAGTALVTGDYVAFFISTNTYASIADGMSVVSVWCFEASAGSPTIKAEVYLVNSVTKQVEYEYEPSPAYQLVPGTPSGLVFSVPVTARATGTNMHIAFGIKQGANGTVRLVTGGTYNSHGNFPLPNSALVLKSGDTMTGPLIVPDLQITESLLLSTLTASRLLVSDGSSYVTNSTLTEASITDNLTQGEASLLFEATNNAAINRIKALPNTANYLMQTDGTGITNKAVGGDLTFSGGNFTVAADSVALTTDTDGNYVSTAAGTANEVDVSGAGTEGRAITIGLPDDLVLGDASFTAITNSGVLMLGTTNLLSYAQGKQPADAQLDEWATVSTNSVTALGVGTLTATTALVGVTNVVTALAGKQPADAQLDEWATVSTNSVPALGVGVLTATTVTGATIDAAVNTLKLTGYADFTHPHALDAHGASIIVTNDYTSLAWGHATFPGDHPTNENYVIYQWVVPPDIDTAIDLTAQFWVVGAGTDADDIEFRISMQDTAAGATTTTAAMSYTSPIVLSVTPTSAAAGDLQVVPSSAATLTGWKAAITAGHLLQICVARHNNDNDDAYSDRMLRINYAKTQ